MTLQRFVMAYIFQPLSLPLNRLAAAKGMEGWALFGAGIGVPVFVTFVAVGVWHGAGWTFVLYGVMQGIYICINEAWRERARVTARARRRSSQRSAPIQVTPAPWIPLAYQLLTLVAVMYSNVMFRAISPSQAFEIWRGMTGAVGPGELGPVAAMGWGLPVALLACGLIVFLAPNTQQIMGRFDPALNWREWREVATAPLKWSWHPSPAGLTFAAAALFMGVMFIQKGRAVFIYFNF